MASGWAPDDSVSKQIEDSADDGVSAARAALNQEGADECEDCGKPIPPERKRVAPFAIRCINCQDRWERYNDAPGVKR